VLNCDRSTVKHALQNTQNDCYQWISNSSRVHQSRFRSGLCPGPRWGSLQRSPDPLAGLRGLLLRGEEGKGRQRREGEGGEEVGEGQGTGNGRERVEIPGKRREGEGKGGRRGGEGG